MPLGNFKACQLGRYLKLLSVETAAPLSFRPEATGTRDGLHSETFWQRSMKHLGFSFCRIRFCCSQLTSHHSFLGLTSHRFLLNTILCGVFPENQENSEHSERIVGLSDDVGAGFISGHSSQSGPNSDLNVDRQVDLSAQDDMGNLGVSKVIRADQKRFFFDLGSNNRGHFLRISEVMIKKTEFNLLKSVLNRFFSFLV